MCVLWVVEYVDVICVSTDLYQLAGQITEKKVEKSSYDIVLCYDLPNDIPHLCESFWVPRRFEPSLQ